MRTQGKVLKDAKDIPKSKVVIKDLENSPVNQKESIILYMYKTTVPPHQEHCNHFLLPYLMEGNVARKGTKKEK